VRRIKVAHFRLILNQYCARYPKAGTGQWGAIQSVAPSFGVELTPISVHSELHSLGWVNGGNLNIDFRFAGAAPDQIGRYARELVELGLDVILVQSLPGLAAVVDATTTIPTIFVQVAVDEPVEARLVRAHSRPGGNMTGFTNFEFSMAGKWVELLKEIAPAVSRVCLIVQHEVAVGHTGYVNAAEAAGRKLGISIFPERLHDSTGIEQAIVNSQMSQLED
jgi:ABC-type uncharacterized transport system substrate-binding protein